MVIAIISSAVGYFSQSTKSQLSALALANIEALSRYELPEVTIECGAYEGDCYIENYGRWVMCGERMFHPCYFTGYKNDSCKSPC